MLHTNSGNSNTHKNNSCPDITPSQALVIAGILSGALEVDSVFVDRELTVQIILEGTLKSSAGDNKINEALDQVGSMSFDSVIGAIVNRIT